LFSPGRGYFQGEQAVKTIIKLMVPVGFALLAGCVIAPVGPRHPYYGPYYGPRVAVVAPAPVLVVRP
jgi:hypothetical protein